MSSTPDGKSVTKLPNASRVFFFEKTIQFAQQSYWKVSFGKRPGMKMENIQNRKIENSIVGILQPSRNSKLT
jgi:hypothetical protein